MLECWTRRLNSWVEPEIPFTWPLIDSIDEAASSIPRTWAAVTDATLSETRATSAAVPSTRSAASVTRLTVARRDADIDSNERIRSPSSSSDSCTEPVRRSPDSRRSTSSRNARALDPTSFESRCASPAAIALESSSRPARTVQLYAAVGWSRFPDAPASRRRPSASRRHAIAELPSRAVSEPRVAPAFTWARSCDTISASNGTGSGDARSTTPIQKGPTDVPAPAGSPSAARPRSSSARISCCHRAVRSASDRVAWECANSTAKITGATLTPTAETVSLRESDVARISPRRSSGFGICPASASRSGAAARLTRKGRYVPHTKPMAAPLRTTTTDSNEPHDAKRRLMPRATTPAGASQPIPPRTATTRGRSITAAKAARLRSASDDCPSAVAHGSPCPG